DRMPASAEPEREVEVDAVDEEALVVAADLVECGQSHDAAGRDGIRYGGVTIVLAVMTVVDRRREAHPARVSCRRARVRRHEPAVHEAVLIHRQEPRRTQRA